MPTTGESGDDHLVVPEEAEATSVGGLAADAGGAALESLGGFGLYMLDALGGRLESNLIGLGLLVGGGTDDGSQGEEGRGTTRAKTLAHGAGILRRHGGDLRSG